MKVASRAARRPRRTISPAPAASAPTASGHPVIMRGESGTRIFIHLLLNFIHRADRERRAFYGDDLDIAAIAETVGIGALEPEMRDPAFRKEFADYDKVVGLERQRPVNALSVSAATGIPRETVRRKLKVLLDRGVLVEKDSGYIYKPGVLQQPHHKAAFERGMRDTLQFINECLKLGLLKLAPRTGRKAQPAKLRQ
jgi:predicted transcriptional regulator